MIFYKASSFGNDFIAIDQEAPAYPQGRRHLGGLPADLVKGELARAICDRQRGVGADGVVFYRPQGRMTHFEIFNQDGGAAELSGNGMACLSAVLLQRRLASSPLLLQSGVGSRRVVLLERRGREFHFDTEVGPPDFDARGFFPFLDGRQGPYRVLATEFHPVAVGNPHAVVLCRRLPGRARLTALGKKLEAHPMFPRRVNVEFVEPTAPGNCRVFFYERGVGPTQASSTGSAAVFAVLRRLGLAREHLVIEPALHPATNEAAAAAEVPAGKDLLGHGPGYPAGIHASWQDGIHIRIVTRLICRGDYCA